MVFWTTGIIEEVINDAFFQTRRTVQSHLNVVAAGLRAGEAVEKIRIVFVINQDPYPREYRRYDRKTKVLDARIRIDYTQFLAATPPQRVMLFAEAMVAALRHTRNPSAEEFDKETVCQVILTIHP